MYYFRDQQGLEVDFLVPGPNLGLWLIEAKTGKTVQPRMAAPLQSLQRSLGKRASRLIVVYRRPRASMITSAINRGVGALALEHFIKVLTQGSRKRGRKSERYLLFFTGLFDDLYTDNIDKYLVAIPGFEPGFPP